MISPGAFLCYPSLTYARVQQQLLINIMFMFKLYLFTSAQSDLLKFMKKASYLLVVFKDHQQSCYLIIHSYHIQFIRSHKDISSGVLFDHNKIVMSRLL